MIEQLNLFGERDQFAELIDRIVDWYEGDKAFCEDHGCYFPERFDTWLLDLFSCHCGGNSSTMLWGDWGWYQFSPSGLKLENSSKLVPRKDGQGTEWESIFFPKKKILEAFGVKDDGKDLLKGDQDE